MKYLFIICILFWNLTGITVAAPDKAQVMELLEGRHWKLVSYTHLRAHETRHELVCRLLLETKTN